MEPFCPDPPVTSFLSITAALRIHEPMLARRGFRNRNGASGILRVTDDPDRADQEP